MGILFSRLRNVFEVFFLIVMGSHDRVLSRGVPCAGICFKVILPAAVCIMGFGGQKGSGGGKGSSRKTHHETSAIVQARDNGVLTGMIVVGIAGQFHSYRALTGESPPQVRGQC